METAKSPAEQRIVLSNVSWETYERLLEERREDRAPRFTYDRGMLEVMSPSSEHESISYHVGLLVAVFAAEAGVDVYGVGSTTFKREDLERGFEPDACFYSRSPERVRGKKRIDLDLDPPPDLIIEVDITSPSIDKLSIYARLVVPEVWRHAGGRFEILALEGGAYQEVERSVVLPSLTGNTLSELVESSRSLDLPRWLNEARERARYRT